MTSNSQGQRILRDRQRSRKNSAWGVALGITFLGVFLSAPAKAAVFEVNSPSDVVGAAPLNDGICATAYNFNVPNGICTLRAAIMEANHAPGGPHTVRIPEGVYTLTIPSAGDSDAAGSLKIVASMSIIGAGSSTTIIDANGSVTKDRGFRTFGNTASIAGVTIRNGAAPNGGGIHNFASTLTLTDTAVRENRAGFAGGIHNETREAPLILINSTVSGNSAGSEGGGIWSRGPLALINSTVSNNHSETRAGGIFSRFNATLLMINSTVSGNTANTNGGGIFNDEFSDVNLFNSTITDNQAGADLNASGIGGGVFNFGIVNFQNTIIAGNSETVFEPVIGKQRFVFGDCAGPLTSNGNNLMRVVVNCTVNGSAPIVASPLLGPLQNNGGPTQTHAPLPGSPAIDAGNPSGCRDQVGALLLKDQRGLRRRVDGNRDGTAQCDIGAVEFGGGAGVTFYSDVDIDGDGRNDIGVYRDGTWFILQSSNGAATAVGFGGLPQDLPVPGDYDGDGKTDHAVYRDGVWFIQRSSDGGTSVLQWGGLLEDVPVPGDYDGDGKTDLAVYRDGTWFILRSFDGGVTAPGWGGLPQDVPVPGDYDGDSRTDLAVYRDGTWFVLPSSGGVIATGWGGLSQDVPVLADYDGDGKTDIAVYRDGTWFILRSSDGGATTIDWGGLIQDVAVPGDYDGDGKADVAVYRDGVWFVLLSSSGGVTQTAWGGFAQDIPLNRRND